MMCTMKRCVALLGLFVLAGVATASAQTLLLFDVRTDRVSLTKTGRSEVLGNITLTADAVCGTDSDGKCVSQGGNIEVLYQGVQIDNSLATGITICENLALGGSVLHCEGGPAPSATTYLNGSVTVTSTTSGGLLTFGVNNAKDFAAGDQILIEGVRGQIDLSFANTPFLTNGAEIDAVLTPSPSTIASFGPSSGPVGFSFDGMTISVAAANILECIGTGQPNVLVQELYPSSFVDNGFGPRGTLPDDPRIGIPSPNTFAATDNTEVNIVVTGLPSGVTLTWPAASAVDSGVGLVGSQLFLLSQSATGNTATYVFQTPDQIGNVETAGSDQFIEQWNIGSGVDAAFEGPGAANCDEDDICVTLSGTPADFGAATVQAQLYPPVSPTTGRPRYNDPLHPSPGLPFLSVGPCTTTLLFPWASNQPGFDTGIAIANTSWDMTNDVTPVLPVTIATPPENGTCTVWGFPKGEGKSLAWTSPNVSAGDTLTFVLSGTPPFPGFTGYIIARCNFQYAHGFAYFNGATGAAGYVALIIPDPVVTGADGAIPARSAGADIFITNDNFSNNEGEILAQ